MYVHVHGMCPEAADGRKYNKVIWRFYFVDSDKTKTTQTYMYAAMS